MTIYSRATCGPCRDLKKHLTLRGVAFIEKSVDDLEHLKELLELTDGRLLLPTVVKGETIIMGLNYGAVAKLLV